MSIRAKKKNEKRTTAEAGKFNLFAREGHSSYDDTFISLVGSSFAIAFQVIACVKYTYFIQE